MADTYACGIEMFRPEEDLYGLLNLSRDGRPLPGKKMVDVIEFMTPSQRYAFKALNDINYKAVYDQRHDTKDLFDAGFFDDGLPQLVREYPASNDAFLSTPFEKLRRRLALNIHNLDVVVLITTGGMAPIHDGHMAMMERAREELEGRGYFVAAGYFAPGHDSYVGQKYGGTAAIDAADRCTMVELATQDSDWLDCDPWAARYMPAEINFTDVVDRLDLYLGTWFNEPINIFYVHGSDNPGFGAALPDRSIMVERTTLSSKLAREGNHDHLNPRVRDYLVNLKDPQTNNLPYLIRHDAMAAIYPSWFNKLGKDEIALRIQRLDSTLRTAIAHFYKAAGERHPIHVLDTEEQRLAAMDVVGDRHVISLEPFFSANKGGYRLRTTRYFAVSSSQLTPLIRAQAPGLMDPMSQAASIPAGDYVLVEDDTVTGGTISTALSLLGPGVNVTEQVILSDFGPHKGAAYHDVVDLRDFIVGTMSGGLGVILNGGMYARAPYALPFVSLRSRAKIPAPGELELSRIIWRANVKFFKDSGIQIRESSEGFRNLADRLGYQETQLISEFCEDQLEFLMP